MNKLTATDARRDFFDIVRGATQKHQVYRIQHRNGSVVLLSEEEYDSLIETLELLSIKGFRESIERSVDQIKRRETVSFEEVFGAD